MPKNKRLLLIESDAFYAQIVKECLTHAGFEVAHATSGEQGIKLALETHPDLILLAIKLPKQDGFEVLEELKSSAETRLIPVAMLTDLGSREDVCQCLGHGACNYFIKSHHSPPDVLAVIQRLLK